MKHRILVDTGPIVAILSQKDQFHKTCIAALKDLYPPLITSWPVITEACWLLRRSNTAIESLFASIEGGLFLIAELDCGAATWIAEFLKRYRTVGAQVADASLAYLAEKNNIESIFTLDKRDFSVYRLAKRRSFVIIPE